MTELKYLDITKAGDGHIKVPSIGLISPAITESIAKTALASFSDGAEGIPVKSLIADINPVQTGSGDPSPSNVRPITGWTGMNVVRTGANVCEEIFEDGYINASGGLAAYANAIRSKNYNPCVPNGTYFYHITQGISGVNIAWYDLNKTFIQRDDNKANIAITAPPNAYFFKLSVYGYKAVNPTYANDISINYPSTDHDYHAYTGTTYPISWADEAGTVYGGTLDVTNGVLTVTHKMLSNITVGNKVSGPSTDSVSIFSVNGTRPADGVKASTSDNYAPPYYCNRFKTNSIKVGVLSNKETGISASKTSNVTYLTVPVSIASTKEEMNTWLSSNQTDIVAELENPQTYQLTPQAVLTILGQNNIWADTGDVEVAYCADTKMYIDKVIAAL